MRTLALLSAFTMLSLSVAAAEEEFAWNVPRVDHELTFPKDHGSHPDFKIEWWYITGHLYAESRRFGFQATFFRLGQEPIDVAPGESFGETQIYITHKGLSDPATGRFLHEERLNRAGWDAGAKVGSLDVFNGDWKLVERGSGMHLIGSIKSEVRFDLQFTPHKRHVI
ncbi:MAG: lipocalin-like domain-containing protein, partial [Verrucomicrobiota bacterium]